MELKWRSASFLVNVPLFHVRILYRYGSKNQRYDIYSLDIYLSPFLTKDTNYEWMQ